MLRVANTLATLLFAGVLMAATMGDNGLNIHISPLVVMVGGSVHLTCRVTPDKRNRKLVYGIAGSGQEGSERQLDGYQAPITWGPVEVKHIPCGAGPAYCIVERQGDRPLQAMQTLEVGGCEP